MSTNTSNEAPLPFSWMNTVLNAVVNAVGRIATAVSVASAAPSVVHITTKTTTLAKTGPGVLKNLVVNTVGSGNTATLYDGVDNTGTVLAVVDTSVQAPRQYNFSLSVGLCIVTAGGTAADISVGFA